MPRAIALLHKILELALRTTTMTINKINDDATATKSQMQTDGDDASVVTEVTDNTRNSNERKCREHLMVFKINHRRQRQQ